VARPANWAVALSQLVSTSYVSLSRSSGKFRRSLNRARPTACRRSQLAVRQVALRRTPATSPFPSPSRVGQDPPPVGARSSPYAGELPWPPHPGVSLLCGSTDECVGLSGCRWREKRRGRRGARTTRWALAGAGREKFFLP
jgi:hypothetical protein